MSKLHGSFTYLPINTPNNEIQKAIIQFTKSFVLYFLVTFINPYKRILTRYKQNINQADPIDAIFNFGISLPTA